MRKIIIILGISTFCLSQAFTLQKEAEQPLNIILMIGDGMGLSQLSSAYFYGEGEPNFSRFPVIGLCKTASSREKITDSAAGATAFSTGKKTFNGAIGLDSDSGAVETLLEYFEKKDFATGLIATSSITHATPASFYAHVDSRNKEDEIASQLAGSGVDFFAGGGRKFFYKGQKGVIEDLYKSGYSLDTNDLKTNLDTNSRYGFLLAHNGMKTIEEGRGNFLQDATRIATDFLGKKRSSFFLMVEASQIDWGGHANNAAYVISEVLDFDKTIGTVLDFAEKDGNTLVIVTADHETGGFSLSGEMKKVPFQGMQRDYNSIDPTFSTGGHTSTLVPVLAFGPGAEKFSGIYENTEIHRKIADLME